MDVTTKRHRLTPGERASLTARAVKKYERGMSIRQIATATGRSYGVVHRLLTEAGMPMRSRCARAVGQEKP